MTALRLRNVGWGRGTARSSRGLPGVRWAARLGLASQSPRPRLPSLRLRLRLRLPSATASRPPVLRRNKPLRKMSHHHRHHLRRFMTLTVFHISRGRLPIDFYVQSRSEALSGETR
uniref:Uncharacterized protein n=1 Tax=Oryza meridionalis TaxID=40149 RepID=A0A0E0EUU0_9ORYZ